MSTEPWPEHWLARDVAANGRVVLVGTLPYHQVVASLDDERSLGILRSWGYRLCRLLSDPRKPAEARRGVFRRQLPDEEEEHGQDEG